MKDERDGIFQREMKNCIDIMTKMPNFKAKVWDKIGHLHSQIENEKGNQGIAFGERAR